MRRGRQLGQAGDAHGRAQVSGLTGSLGDEHASSQRDSGGGGRRRRWACARQPGQAQDYGSPLKWYGSIYAKFLDGNRRYEQGLYSNAETTPGEGGGDQGQGIELELMLSSQVSKQVEIGARIHSRFNKNFWANYGGFACPTDRTSAPNCLHRGRPALQPVHQAARRLGASSRPGYDWMDSATIGNSDWGMFDPWTQGKSRYIDRDNLGGFLFQGSALDKTLRWDLARVSRRSTRACQFTAPGDADSTPTTRTGSAQLKYTPSPDWNATLIAMYAQDNELDPDDANVPERARPRARAGTTRWSALKGQYTGLGFMDVSGVVLLQRLRPRRRRLRPATLLGSCRFSPTAQATRTTTSFYLNLNFNRSCSSTACR